MILSGQLRRALINVSMENNARIITLTDPARHNALSLDMLNQLSDALTTTADCRAIVLRSGGAKVFSAGHDLTELRSGTGKHGQIFGLCADVMRTIREVDVPVIAAVDGIAAAAGCQMVAACDIVLATSKSKFSVPGVNLGIYCHSPGVELGRAIPKKAAMYMLTTGQYLLADDAFSLGLISRLARDGEELEMLLEQTINAINATSRFNFSYSTFNTYSIN